MTAIVALSDHSDIPLLPDWVLWLILAVVAALLVIAVVAACLPAASREMPTPNAAPTGTTLHVPAACATNPECVRRGHAVSRLGDSVWVCWREGCLETWFSIPERAPFDQERSA